MDQLRKKLCTEEERISEQQFLTELYLFLKSEYIADTHNNGEKISVKFLNGQKFEIRLKEV